MSPEELRKICEMTPEERSLLDRRTKRRVVEALLGEPVSPVLCECYDPVATAKSLLGDTTPFPRRRESRDVYRELFFESSRKTARLVR